MAVGKIGGILKGIFMILALVGVLSGVFNSFHDSSKILMSLVEVARVFSIVFS